MRELLREVYDRLGECAGSVDHDPQDPDRLVSKLRLQVGEVLARGIFDGRMTGIDMANLPPVLR